MKKLYARVLEKAISIGVINTESKILVVGGGPNDFLTLRHFNFQNVVISNLAPHGNQTDFNPYTWVRSDLNELKFENNSFDLVIVSAALHHLYSPHRGLCEMLRVSSKAVIFIESSDNILSKFARKIGFVPSYEIDAILNDGKGGVENSSIPNFIYRWTRSEVKKTVNSFLPHTSNSFCFFHNYELPVARLNRSKNIFIKATLPLIWFLKLFLKTFIPRQANEFGVLIIKGQKLHPWLIGKTNNPKLNLAYLRENYNTTL